MQIPFLDRLTEWLDRGDGVQIVANDVQLTAELMLLVRMMFADGELRPEEMTNFKRICTTAFGIPEDEVPRVVRYLSEIGYDISVSDAASEFLSMDVDRKRSLLLHMYSIAKADNELDASEAEMIRKTAAMLGLTADDIRALKNV